MTHDNRIREYQTTYEAISGTHIQVEYRLRPEEGHSLEESTFNLLLITSLGAITPLKYEPGYERALVKRTVEELGGYMLVQEHRDGSGLVTLALPLHLCSPRESLTGLLQLIASGGEYRYTSEYWIERLALPPAFIARYQGPRFGVAGVRHLLDVQQRAPLGLVLKPRHGTTLDTLCQVAGQALLGGCDFICDDVLLGDPEGELSIANRSYRLAALVAEAERSTGEKKSYFCNVSARPSLLAENVTRCLEAGVDGVIVNGFTIGLGGLEELVEGMPADNRLPVITTDMGVSLMARAPTRIHTALTQTGMSETIYAKLSRLAGADCVHTGTVAANCYGEMEWNRITKGIREPLQSIEPCFAVAEGDLGLPQLWPNISSLGPDVLIEVASAIVNYPDGPRRGAEVFREVIETLDPVEMSNDDAVAALAGIADRDSTVRGILDGANV